MQAIESKRPAVVGSSAYLALMIAAALIGLGVIFFSIIGVVRGGVVVSFLAAGVVYLAIGFGMFWGHNWARIAFLLLTPVLLLIVGALELSADPRFRVVISIGLSLVLWPWMCFQLTRDEVLIYFGANEQCAG